MLIFSDFIPALFRRFTKARDERDVRVVVSVDGVVKFNLRETIIADGGIPLDRDTLISRAVALVSNRQHALIRERRKAGR